MNKPKKRKNNTYNHRTISTYLRAKENLFLKNKLQREVEPSDLSEALLEKYEYYEI